MQEDPIPPIPKPLNEPVKLSKWTLQEIGMFIGIFVGVWMIASMVLGLILAVASIWINKLLQNSPYGDLTKKGKYWFLPHNGSKYKVIIPSFIREIIG